MGAINWREDFSGGVLPSNASVDKVSSLHPERRVLLVSVDVETQGTVLGNSKNLLLCWSYAVYDLDSRLIHFIMN